MTKQFDLSLQDKAGQGTCCPHCGSGKNGVVDSRPAILGGNIHTVRRRRKCTDCQKRFTTFEIPAEIIERLDAVANDRRTPSRREVIRACIAQLEGML